MKEKDADKSTERDQDDEKEKERERSSSRRDHDRDRKDVSSVSYNDDMCFFCMAHTHISLYLCLKEWY